jgi:hypothetical protein
MVYLILITVPIGLAVTVYVVETMSLYLVLHTKHIVTF